MTETVLAAFCLPRSATKITGREWKMADTFCILPWIHLAVFPVGSTKLCCIAGQSIKANGIPMSLQVHTLDEVWNSRHLQTVRGNMLMGRPVDDCTECYNAEKNFGISHRMQSNARWADELGPLFHSRVEDSKFQGLRVPELPIYYQLMPGNFCNLKCRMCFPVFSSKIEQDVVHRQWAPPLLDSSPEVNDQRDWSETLDWTQGRTTIGPQSKRGVKIGGMYP